MNDDVDVLGGYGDTLVSAGWSCWVAMHNLPMGWPLYTYRGITCSTPTLSPSRVSS